MSRAITAFQGAFRDKFERVLADVHAASGAAAAKQLKKQLRSRVLASRELGFRVNAPVEIKDWDFDATSPDAKRWVTDHATELIDGMSQSTRDDVRDLIDRSFDGEFDVHDLADEIENLIGDADRAETIARTETMTASNQGQLDAWDQATEAGLLTGNETKEWIVTPDDRLCPICEPLDGVNVGLDERFDVEGDQIDGPPAHPRCRCTVALSV